MLYFKHSSIRLHMARIRLDATVPIIELAIANYIKISTGITFQILLKYQVTVYRSVDPSSVLCISIHVSVFVCIIAAIKEYF